MKTEIFHTGYKDRPAIAIRTPLLTAVFLPEDGAKLASLRRTSDGHEYMESAPGETYLRLFPDSNYVDCECSSFDDMFPTIDPYTPQSGRFRGVTYPDHGEVARLPFTLTETEDAFTLSLVSPLFGYTYHKKVSADADGGIHVDYTVQNSTGEDFPCIFAAHCMLHGEDDARVFSSYPDDAAAEMTFGPAGKTLDGLPRDRLTGYQPKNGYAYKYYYTEPAPSGHFGVRYADGYTLDFGVDNTVMPYLGVWLNNGRFKDMYNIALECCTAPFDAPDKAAARGYDCVLKKEDTLAFSLLITLRKEQNHE